MYPHKLSLALLLLFSLPATFARQVEKKLVFTMPGIPDDKLTSVIISFDAYGNYCYYTHNGEEVSGLVLTNTHSYGPFKKNDSHKGPVIFYNEKDKDQYIIGKHSGRMCGPIDGEIDVTSYPFQVREDNFNFIVSRGDSFGYYINGSLIATTNGFPCTNNWCVYSDKGHALYTIKSGRLNYLYLDEKPIDSAADDYAWLEVDDAGNYRYALGRQVSYISGCGTLEKFTPYPRSRQKTFAPMTIQSREYTGVNYDSIYVYQNGAGGTFLSSVNRTQWNKARRTVITSQGNPKNNLGYDPFTGWRDAVKDTSVRIYVNDKPVNLRYTAIFLPCIDSLGNYALFGQRGYYMYRNINGVEQEQPLSEHGVRAKPISIDALGNTICYYQTDDSVYVYENDSMFGKCALAQFKLVRQDEIIPIYREEGDMRDHEPSLLSGFCLDSICYLVYRNTISPPMRAFENYHSGEARIAGDIIYSDITKDGFCVLQKTGNRKYSLLVNNRLIPFPPDADFDTQMWFTLTQSFSFTGNEFVFYSKEGSAIYQYKMKL